MKRMKTLLCLILAFTMIFCFAACGDDLTTEQPAAGTDGTGDGGTTPAPTPASIYQTYTVSDNDPSDSSGNMVRTLTYTEDGKMVLSFEKTTEQSGATVTNGTKVEIMSNGDFIYNMESSNVMTDKPYTFTPTGILTVQNAGSMVPIAIYENGTFAFATTTPTGNLLEAEIGDVYTATGLSLPGMDDMTIDGTISFGGTEEAPTVDIELIAVTDMAAELSAVSYTLTDNTFYITEVHTIPEDSTETEPETDTISVVVNPETKKATLYNFDLRVVTAMLAAPLTIDGMTIAKGADGNITITVANTAVNLTIYEYYNDKTDDYVTLGFAIKGADGTNEGELEIEFSKDSETGVVNTASVNEYSIRNYTGSDLFKAFPVSAASDSIGNTVSIANDGTLTVNDATVTDAQYYFYGTYNESHRLRIKSALISSTSAEYRDITIQQNYDAEESQYEDWRIVSFSEFTEVPETVLTVETGAKKTYSFTPDEDGTYIITGISVEDNKGALYTDFGTAEQNQIDSSDDALGMNFQMTCHLTGGTEYTVEAEFYNKTVSGNIAICIEKAPAVSDD